MEFRRDIFLRSLRLTVSRLWFVLCRFYHSHNFLLNCNCEDGVRAGRSLVHMSLSSHTLCNTLVQVGDALGFCGHYLRFETIYADRAILRLLNLKLFSAMSGELVEDDCIKQVTHVVSVELKELYLHVELTEVRLFPPVLNLLKDEVEHSWHNSDLLIGQTNSASRSHCMRLSRTCLTIREDGCVITGETAEYKVP